MIGYSTRFTDPHDSEIWNFWLSDHMFMIIAYAYDYCYYELAVGGWFPPAAQRGD
jgi:hypothetical protein